MEKPWFNHYQDGVPKEIDSNTYNSIPELLEESFKKFADKPAFHCMGKTLNYSDMDLLSKKS